MSTTEQMGAARIDHVVVPGTFDPVTLGHMDVISRTRKLFPRVTVAVAASVNKRGRGTAFTLEVLPFTGLLVDFCHGIGALGVVKGLRAMTDFEYELQQADLNCHMAPDIESVFVMSNPKYGYVSSSIVREISSMGSDVSSLVPPCVNQRLREHYCA